MNDERKKNVMVSVGEKGTCLCEDLGAVLKRLAGSGQLAICWNDKRRKREVVVVSVDERVMQVYEWERQDSACEGFGVG